MQTAQDQKANFEEFFKGFFKALKVEYNSKHPLYKDLLLPMEEHFQLDLAKSHPNINKYIPMLLALIETRLPKIVDISLVLLQKLALKEMIKLSGSAYFLTYPNENSPFLISKLSNTTAIDSISNALFSIPCDKDEMLINATLRLLRTLFFSEPGLHQDTLANSIDFLIRLYANAKKLEVQTVIKSHLTSNLGLLFQRLRCSENVNRMSFRQPTFVIHNSFDIFFRKASSECIAPNSSCEGGKMFHSHKLKKKREKSMDFGVMRTQNSLGSPLSTQFSITGFFSENDSKDECFFRHTATMEENERASVAEEQVQNEELTESLGEIVKVTVEVLVDEVCLNVKGGNMCRRVVPREAGGEFTLQDFANIENEIGKKGGKFGWCSICRNSANFYCLMTRMPVCSPECKRAFLEMEEKAEMDIKKRSPDPEFLEDFLYVLRICAKNALGDINSGEADFKAKIFSLEIVASALDYFGAFYMGFRTAVAEIRDLLSELVLRNCLSQEKQVFVISFKVFLILVTNYRDFLKEEIQVLFEQIVLKLLNSGNSGFSHRFYSLQVLNKILSSPNIVLEFFLSYDCEMTRLNIVEKLFETLSKISQGKYSKEEYSTILQPNQELTLRSQALESVSVFLKGLLANLDYDIEKSIDIIENPSNFNLIAVSSSDNLLDFPENEAFFEKSKALKQEIARAIVKFNTKPEFGIKHLISIGYLEAGDHKTLASFLKNTPEINKDKLGELIAKPDYAPLLYEFTNLCDFKDLPVDNALRSFLSFFTLPGEAQQVDRCLQAFSQRYSNQNMEGPLKSAEAVYLLSYSMMILQTDIHNPQVKEKMKLADFLRMTGKINDGEDLSPEFLKSTYQGIIEKPLALHQSAIINKNSPIDDKVQLFIEESRKIVESGQQALFKLKTKRMHSSPFRTVMTPCTVKLLLETIWSPVFASCSVGFENANFPPEHDEKFRDFCLQSMETMLKLSLLMGLGDIRDTLLLTLVKFTNVGAPNFARKNLDCLKRLLELLVSHGKFLGTAWKYIINLLSKLDSLRSSKTHELLLELDPFLIDKVLSGTRNYSGETLLIIIGLLREKAVEELNDTKGYFYEETRTFSLSKLVEIAEANMERARVVWSKLWSKVTDFLVQIAGHQNRKIGYFTVEALKRMALRFLQNDELAGFQKEVFQSFERVLRTFNSSQCEIKEFLINSVIFLMQNFSYKLKSGWKVILLIINLTFSEQAFNLTILGNRMLKIIVEDQSNMSTFLENPRDFLKTIYKAMNSPQDSIRSDSIDFLMKYLKTLFDYLGIQPLNTTNNNALRMTEEFSGTTDAFHLSSVVSNLDENRMKINLSSVIIEENNCSSQENFKNSDDFGAGFFEEDSILSSPTLDPKNLRRSSILREQPGFREEDWFEILYNLKEKFKDPAMKVRETALEALFTILLSFGYSFLPEFWIRVYREIIRRSFEDLVKGFLDNSSTNNAEVNVSRFLLKKGVITLAKLQGLYLTDCESFMREFLDIIGFFLGARNEFLAKLALGALKGVIQKVSKKFTRGCWRVVVRFLCENLEEALPRQLMNKENLEVGFPKNSAELMKGYGSVFSVFRPVNLSFDVREVLTKSLDILLLVGIVGEITVQSLGIEEIEALVKSLEKCYDFAMNFNKMVYLRYCLWKNGFLQEMKELPGLIKQEKETLFCLVRLEVLAYQGKNCEDRMKCQRFLDDFIIKTISVVNEFNSLCENSIKQRKERDFLAKIQHRTMNNILEISGSKTPDSRVSFQTKEKSTNFSSASTEELSLRSKKKLRKKTEEKGSPELIDSIEMVMRDLEVQENARKLKNLRSILCFLINSLIEIRPSEIKNLKKLVSELLILNRNGFSHCLSCGVNESEDSVNNLTDFLSKCYDYAFNKI